MDGVDGQRDGPLKEWYAEGEQRLEEGYKAGKRDGMSRTWDESGRLTSQERYRNDRLDGKAEKWNYEGSDWGELEIAYHQQDDRPYMIERFAFAAGQQGLIERTIPDSDGPTLYSARKSDCDSTRIDTLYGGRMTIEIRDFREGRIRSLERYDPTHFYGFLVPDGVFELYGPDERVGTRILYEGGGFETNLELPEELFAVNGTTGLIASGISYFDGEQDLTVYRRIEDEDAGTYFEVVFWIMLTEVPEAVWGMYWIGDSSLLLVMDKSCLRVDIAPESLERHEDEHGCP